MQSRLLATVTFLIASSALQAAAAPKAPFVVHEWGTFTSVQGQDGKQVQWAPFVRTDLPKFVYDLERATTRDIVYFGAKQSTAATVRMETPVIYFYSDTQRVVDVRVSFPEGRVTEWYPQAFFIGPYTVNNAVQTAEQRRSLIEWKGVTILAPDSGEMSANRLIREDGPASHYYSARATDANFVRVTSPRAQGVEYERDLFYRGVGFFPDL